MRLIASCDGRSRVTGASCENNARYVTADGLWLCGVCDLMYPAASIRLLDIPTLLLLLTSTTDPDHQAMRALLCKKTKIS